MLRTENANVYHIRGEYCAMSHVFIGSPKPIASEHMVSQVLVDKSTVKRVAPSSFPLLELSKRESFQKIMWTPIFEEAKSSISDSKGYSPPRNLTQVSCMEEGSYIADGFFTNGATREAPSL